MKNRSAYRWSLFLALLGLDLLSKQVAVLTLKPLGTWPVGEAWFQLSYVENTGAAFGRFADHTHALMVVSLICIGVLTWALRQASSHFEQMGFLLILTGAFGNLVDRFLRGYVVDFFDVDIPDVSFSGFGNLGPWNLDRWPVFNFADSYICIGTLLVMGFLIFSETKRSNGTPQ